MQYPQFILQAAVLEGLQAASVTGVAVTVSLGKEGNFFRLQAAVLYQRPYHSVDLFSVAGAIVDHEAVGWRAAQDTRTGEGGEEQGSMFLGDGDRGDRRWRAEITDQCQDLVFAKQFLHVRHASGWLIAVVENNQLQRSVMNAAAAVGAGQSGQHPLMQLFADLRQRSGEGGRHAEAQSCGRVRRGGLAKR